MGGSDGGAQRYERARGRPDRAPRTRSVQVRPGSSPRSRSPVDAAQRQYRMCFRRPVDVPLARHGTEGPLCRRSTPPIRTAAGFLRGAAWDPDPTPPPVPPQVLGRSLRCAGPGGEPLWLRPHRLAQVRNPWRGLATDPPQTQRTPGGRERTARHRPRPFRGRLEGGRSLRGGQPSLQA